MAFHVEILSGIKSGLFPLLPLTPGLMLVPTLATRGWGDVVPSLLWITV